MYAETKVQGTVGNLSLDLNLAPCMQKDMHVRQDKTRQDTIWRVSGWDVRFLICGSGFDYLSYQWVRSGGRGMGADRGSFISCFEMGREARLTLAGAGVREVR